jgi:hypothetical protein
MSYLLSAGVVIVGIILIILAFKLLRGLIKTASIAVLLGLVIFGSSFMVLYKDYQTVQGGLAEDAVVHFQAGNETVAALNITQGEASTLSDLDAKGKITFVMTEAAFDDGDFVFNGEPLSAEQTDEVFQADTVTEVGDALALTGNERIALRQRYSSAQEIKNTITLITVSEKVQSQPNKFLLQGIREGTISVKPELLTVRFINYIPDSIIDRAWGTAKRAR